MIVVSKQNTEHYNWGENCDGWHLVKSQNLSIIQEQVPYGSLEIRHFHEKSEQFFFVLSGVATIEVRGKEHKLNRYCGIHIPAGIPHQLRNKNSEDLVFIVTSTPPSHGDRIHV